MSTLVSEIEQAMPLLDPESARHFEKAVREMLWLARGKEAAGESDFERLAGEELALRERMRQQGRQFAASDRLTRDEVHERHALR